MIDKINLTPQTRITVSVKDQRCTIDGVDYKGREALLILISIAHHERGWAALKRYCGIKDKVEVNQEAKE